MCDHVYYDLMNCPDCQREYKAFVRRLDLIPSEEDEAVTLRDDLEGIGEFDDSVAD